MFFAFTYINTIYANALTAGNPALFINGQATVAKSHPEDRRYLYRLHPRNEILMCLYEILETSKKQDLTPFKNHLPSISVCDYNQKTLSGE